MLITIASTDNNNTEHLSSDIAFTIILITIKLIYHYCNSVSSSTALPTVYTSFNTILLYRGFYSERNADLQHLAMSQRQRPYSVFILLMAKHSSSNEV